MRDPGRSQAAFLARLTAGVTHEVRNVLAIVKESAGLVDDLVKAAGPGRAPDPERVLGALGRVEAQVARGAELMTSLNRLAHGLDRTEEPLDLAEALLHVERLCRRFARLAERDVEVLERAEVPTVTASPLEVYMALVAGLEWQLAHTPDDAVVVVEADGGGGRPRVRFGARAPAPGGDGRATPEEWSDLLDGLDGLPVVAERHPDGAGFSLIFA